MHAFSGLLKTEIRATKEKKPFYQQYKVNIICFTMVKALCGLGRAFDLFCVSLALVTLHLTYCSFQLGMLPKPPNPHQLPWACRRSIMESYGVGVWVSKVEDAVWSTEHSAAY